MWLIAMIKFYCFLVPAVFIGLHSEVVCSLVLQKRAPPDEYDLNEPQTLFSPEFKNWNASLKKAKIIPDVLSKEVPHPLTVVYFGDNVEFGTLLEYYRVDVPPLDLDWLPQKNEYYTAIMTDPDFPDPKNPSRKEYLHWMTTNIKYAFIKNGETMARYVPPSTNRTAKNANITCKGTHRIVFVVYKQLSGSLNVQPDLFTSPEQLDHIPVIPYNREKFSSKDFAKEYNLVPYAANYFKIDLEMVEEE